MFENSFCSVAQALRKRDVVFSQPQASKFRPRKLSCTLCFITINISNNSCVFIKIAYKSYFIFIHFGNGKSQSLEVLPFGRK